MPFSSLLSSLSLTLSTSCFILFAAHLFSHYVPLCLCFCVRLSSGKSPFLRTVPTPPSAPTQFPNSRCMRIVLELKLRSLVACSASCTCVGVRVRVIVFLYVCVRQRNGRFIIQDYPAGIEAPPPCSTKYSPYPDDAIDDMFASPACLPGTIIDLSLSLGLRLRLGMSLGM